MQRRNQKIFDDYAKYLEEHDITYHDRQGFSVRFKLKNADVAFIDVAQKFDFTTIEDLHERVCRLAGVVDEGAGIGKETLGESFDR